MGSPVRPKARWESLPPLCTKPSHSATRQASGNLITWEFPRLCRGGSRSLTYTAVVLQEACDGLKTRRDAYGAGRPCIKAEAGGALRQTEADAFVRDGLQLDIFEAAMSSWELLGVSVIGTGCVSPASPSRFERLTY
jgi:hypothetical protein